MTNFSKILLIILIAFYGKAIGQNGISFANITVTAATQRANIENKNIFIDAYAPWCGPCKIMDIHFKDPEVVNYFNRNFINVKIDTDTKYGKKVSAKYGIAFLPTILILDKDGQTRFKVDKLITKDELLSLAKYAMDGPKYPKPTAPTVSAPSPPKAAATKKRAPSKKEQARVVKKIEPVPTEDSDEKILYVLDANATDLPPEILYEETYFRLQLNDGSHKDAAAKYLATQENWLTEKNVKFIFDFLFDTESEEFLFFVDNRSFFEKHIQEEKINRSLKILIENKLYQGIPRPNFEESEYLLSLIDKENAEKNNYLYFLNRLFIEKNDGAFLSMADKYFKEYEVPNQEITIKYISKKLEGTNTKGKLKTLASLLSKIETPDENYSYLVCNSKLYLALSDKAKAISFANKAIDLAKENKLDAQEAVEVLENIKEL